MNTRVATLGSLLLLSACMGEVRREALPTGDLVAELAFCSSRQGAGALDSQLRVVAQVGGEEAQAGQRQISVRSVDDRVVPDPQMIRYPGPALQGVADRLVNRVAQGA